MTAGNVVAVSAHPHALPPTGRFADDDGSADPPVLAALISFATSGDVRPLQQALLRARLLVPVVATSGGGGAADADGTHGHAGAEAHLATVTLTGHDGRLALPVFTSLATMAAWDPAARPVPAPAVEAARGAYEEDAVALVLDVAGPVTATLEGPALLALAEGRPWLPPAEDPDVLAAVGAALAGLPGLAKVDVGTCDDADLRLTLHIPDAGPGDHASAREVAQAAAERLAGTDLLRIRLERGLDLAVIPG